MGPPLWGGSAIAVPPPKLFGEGRRVRSQGTNEGSRAFFFPLNAEKPAGLPLMRRPEDKSPQMGPLGLSPSWANSFISNTVSLAPMRPREQGCVSCRSTCVSFRVFVELGCETRCSWAVGPIGARRLPPPLRCFRKKLIGGGVEALNYFALDTADNGIIYSFIWAVLER